MIVKKYLILLLVFVFATSLSGAIKHFQIITTTNVSGEIDPCG